MTQSSTERKIRARLPIARLITAYLPLPIARWFIQRGLDRVQLPGDMKQQAVSADGVRCLWLSPENSPDDQVLLYLHGGGFIYGLTSLHVEMVVFLAKKMNMRVLMVDYRLAPEHPFPAALEDCVTAYCWLLQQGFAAKNIVIAGDSAGGNLTITTLMKLRDSSTPLPSAAACLSPVINLTGESSHVRMSYDLVCIPGRLAS